MLASGEGGGGSVPRALPELIREHNVFRGKVVSFEGTSSVRGSGRSGCTRGRALRGTTW